MSFKHQGNIMQHRYAAAIFTSILCNMHIYTKIDIAIYVYYMQHKPAKCAIVNNDMSYTTDAIESFSYDR